MAESATRGEERLVPNRSENIAHREAVDAVRLAKGRAIFTAIRDAGPSSVADLVEVTKLSRPTVVAQLRELVSKGLVVEVEDVVGALGGRPAAVYGIPGGSSLLLGLDLLDQSMALAVASLDGRLVHWDTGRLPRVGDPEDRIRVAAEITRRSLAEAGLSFGQLMAVGVSHTGTVDDQGVLTRATLLPESVGLPLRERLETSFGCPVVVTNDINAAAFGEYVARCAQNEAMSSLLYVRADPGINVGLVLNGAPFQGAKGNAGEVSEVARINAAPTEGEWLSSAAHTVALATALFDPDALVIDAPREVLGSIIDKSTNSLRQAHLDAEVAVVQPARLGSAASLAGVIALGSQLGVSRAFDGESVSPVAIAPVDALTETLVERRHLLTIPRRTVPARSPKARIGVVGATNRLPLALFAEEVDRGAGIVAVCDSAPDAAETVNRLLRHEVQVVPQISDLIDLDVEVVFVLGQPTDHHAHCLPLLQRGIAVFVEGVLAPTVDEARQMVEAARANGAVLHVGHPLRHAMLVQHMVEVLRERRIGDLRDVLLRRLGTVADGPALPAEADVDLLDVALHLAGDYHAVSVTGLGADDGGGHARTRLGVIGLENGVAVTVQELGAVRGSSRQITLVGDTGRIEGTLSPTFTSLHVLDGAQEEVIELPEVKVDRVQADSEMVGEFLRAVQIGEQDDAQLDEALALVQLVEKRSKLANQGRTGQVG